MEASALQAPAVAQAVATRSRLSLGTPLLRLRSDEQLVALFRAGHDEAFRVIHDRYRQRLFAYARQMLPGSRQDAEDALQDVFVRAYSGLRASDRELALRAWLYRVAHNRCVDEMRRPEPPSPEMMELVRPPIHDPIEQAEQRESLRRLVADLRRLPDQQRSALLMRELGGMSYAELAGALGVSVPAVKSLLVRARVGLAQALEARETDCAEIRDDLIVAHDRGVRPNATARRHLRDCAACREFRAEVRGMSRQFAALVPALGPVGLLAKLLGVGGGAGWGPAAGGSAAAGGGAAAATGTGAFAAGGVLATGAGHVATLLAAAVVTAGGAVEIQPSILAPPARHHAHHHVAAAARKRTATAGQPATPSSTSVAIVTTGSTAPAAQDPAPSAPPAAAPVVASPRVAPTLAIQAQAHPGAVSGTPPIATSGGSAAAGGSTTSGPTSTPTASGSPTTTVPGDGTGTPGAPSSAGGTQSNPPTGTPAGGGAGSQTGATAPSTPQGGGGAPQSGSSSSSSVTVTVSLGSDSGSSGASDGSGFPAPSH